jgi:hypothetical protein
MRYKRLCKGTGRLLKAFEILHDNGLNFRTAFFQEDCLLVDGEDDRLGEGDEQSVDRLEDINALGQAKFALDGLPLLVRSAVSIRELKTALTRTALVVAWMLLVTLV